jgi:hypothetical protein
MRFLFCSRNSLCRSGCIPLPGVLAGAVLCLCGTPASAACTNTTTGIAVTAASGQPAAGETVVCDTTAPNPTIASTTITATGNNVTVTVQSGSRIQSTGRAIGVLSNSTITNMGAITPSGLNAFGISSLPGSDAVLLINRGTITTTGSSGHGLDARGTNTTINNSGTVTVSGSGAAGIRIATGANNAVITNSGTVVGTTGALLQANGGMLTNTGTLTGTTGLAASLTGNNNVLQLGTGTVLNGNVTSTGTGNALILTGSGTEDTSFTGFSKLTVDQNAGTWTLTGSADTSIGTTSATNIQAGNLVVAGTLANNNGGGVTIASGATLAIGNGGVTGIVSGAIDTEGTLAFNRSGSIDIANVISGAGNVTIGGPSGAVVRFTADNVFSGITTINGGATLQLGTGGTTGSVAGAIDTEGTLAFNRSGSIDIAKSYRAPAT